MLPVHSNCMSPLHVPAIAQASPDCWDVLNMHGDQTDVCLIASSSCLQCAGDLLLKNKEHAELLQPYEQRAEAAVRFIHAVRPGLKVQTAALRDPKVQPACHERG